MIDLIQAASLPPGTHWLRFLYMHLRGKALASEVLLDNETREDWQDAMAALP